VIERIDGLTILGLTPEGRTAEFLQLNSYERLAERQELMQAGRNPPQGVFHVRGAKS
jgi:hypothetical protein